MQKTFQQLDAFLSEHQSFWRYEPFHLALKVVLLLGTHSSLN